MKIINKLKTNKQLNSLFHKVVIRRLAEINPTIATKVLYNFSQGKRLNLSNARTLNEKLQYLKLKTYYNNPTITQCVDKYRVREYLIERGYARLLNDLEGDGFYKSPNDIDFDVLPNRFVLKCNHDSGSIIVCTDKNGMDRAQVVCKLNQSLNHEYWKDNVEIQYKYVKKGIVCEKYLEDEEKGLVDYKFYCYNGIPKLLYCTLPHKKDEKLQMNFYDLNWNKLPIHRKDTVNIKNPVKKPEKFNEMIEIASELSAPFPFVRIDLFCVNNKIYFGEFTFVPTAGLAKYEEPNADEKLGEMLII